jgi:hypothetical protein
MLLERFDQMKQQRALLAEQMLLSEEVNSEHVLQFFDDMGLLLQDGYVDEEFVWGTFSFSATRWWALCEDSIVEERRNQNDDSLFNRFEDLAARFSKHDADAGFREPTVIDLIGFLEAETGIS